MIAKLIWHIPDFAVPFALAALGRDFLMETQRRTGARCRGLILVSRLAGVGAILYGGATIWR